MKFWPALLIVLTLCACGVPGTDEAGPPPADYKDVIIANMPQTPQKNTSQAKRHSFDALIATTQDHDIISPYLLHDVQISEPQPGRLEFIPGWRVCLRASVQLPDNMAPKKDPNPYKGDYIYSDTRTYSDPKTWAYFFVKGSLDKIVKDDPPCDGYTYTAWPELSDLGRQGVDKYLHPKWQYGKDYDYLKQTDTEFASLTSKNFYVLGFPYAGNAHAVLGIAKDGAGFDAMLMLDRGVFQCKTDCAIQARFDQDPIETLTLAHDENERRSSLTFENSARFIERLKTSHALVIEVPIANSGSKQFVFATDGLTLAKIGTVVTTQDPFIHTAGGAEHEEVNRNLPR